MKHILVDLETKQGFSFSCKSEISNRLEVSAQTLSNWMKEGNTKQTKEYIICFEAREYKNKTKVRKHGF